MNNTMSSTQKGQPFRASDRRRIEPRRAPSLNRFVCIKMSSNAESHYWNVEVEAEERGDLFIQFWILTSAREAVVIVDMIPNRCEGKINNEISNTKWSWVIKPILNLSLFCINSPQSVKYLYPVKVILSTSGQGPHVVTAGGPLTPLSPVNHQEQLKGMHHFPNGCSHTSWEDNTPLREFTCLFFHGTYWYKKNSF